MRNQKPSNINIALVGVGAGESHLCIELLKKTIFDVKKGNVTARIVAVSDPDPESPGIILAKKAGLETTTDYRTLYEPRENIHLIILLTPNSDVFDHILKTRPDTIRILSYSVFVLFWEAIGREEAKLRERNLEIETILNGIQDFILVISPDREISYANDAFLKKMHYAKGEVIGKKCFDVFRHGSPPCLEGDFSCPLNEVIRNEIPAIRELERVNRRDERRFFEVTVFPLWETDGKIHKFIEISRDITERKKEEEETTRRLELMVEKRTRELKETHDKLIHQDKMASLGKLSASMVHEINNPIAGILNMILLINRIVEEGKITGDELKEFTKYLNLMETETRRVSRIVSNLLSFSRQARIELKPLDINTIIEKTLLLNSNLLKINNINVKKEFDSNLPEIIGSEDQLQQVFMNIISNSAEAMETQENGVLSIQTMQPIKNRIISVIFKDTGVGISKKNIHRLFEPFYTTKRKGKGVGLGLSVAYGIVQEHGGVIQVESQENNGSTFTIELPIKKLSEDQYDSGGANDRH